VSRTRAISALFAAVLTGLAGCVSPEEMRAEDEATCVGYGFQRGTPDFAACLQREALARRYYAPGLYGPPYLGPERPWWYVPPQR
jgi:hypothetical protein